VKNGREIRDLVTPIFAAPSVAEGLATTLRRLVELTGATAGALAFRPRCQEPIVVTAAARRAPAALRDWLTAVTATPAPRPRLTRVVPPGAPPSGAAALLRTPLGAASRRVGELVLLGRVGGLTAAALPADLSHELGTALDHLGEREQRTRRAAALGEITRVLTTRHTIDDVLAAFAEGAGKLVRFDSISVLLLDAERREFEVIDVTGRAAQRPRERWMALEGTLLARVVADGAPVRVDDVERAEVPEASRRTLAAAGYRAVALVPVVSGGHVLGAVALAAARPRAFDDADVETITELARPLGLGIERWRLAGESRRQADELAALHATSQLITARLDVASILDRISLSVPALIGASGCGIGLLNGERTLVVQAAAHGFQSEAWRTLSLPVGDGIIGRVAAEGVAIRVGDVQTDPRSARREVDEREGIRSLLCVPLKVVGAVIGVVSAFSTRARSFTAHHQRVLEAFAEQAAIAIHDARLFDESIRGARETRALLEAGRAVTASLDVGRTIRMILEEARGVLGVDSCSVSTFDPPTNELVMVASLDVPQEMVSTIRLRPGEGVTGRAVQARRPMQSRDLWSDSRGKYPHLARRGGFRSMLAVPLCVGERAIGAISVLRRDVHEFSAHEEELLVALADQAAIALEHARLYTELEAMVADRTRELDSQKRFVEVVLETLPLGVFVLDTDLNVVRVNSAGGRALACEAGSRGPLVRFLPADKAAPVQALLREAFRTRRVGSIEEEMVVAGDAKIFRLTAAPVGAASDRGTHAVLLVEDVTLAKRLERQMLLTERLTTAGHLAAGVAHELNNPLATIAGCAESLHGRLGDGDLAPVSAPEEFRHYLRLIEEEAYRCKEITGSLLQFVRDPGSQRGATDLNGVVLKAAELLSHQSRFARSRVMTELDPALPPVAANEGQLRQVCLGLASNALEAMEGRGILIIRSRHARGEVEIELEDEGPGIPQENLGRIFDPFFTTKPPGQGTGLGLAIAQGIVNDHGGRIEVSSVVGKGSVFRVVLPL
jgi:signal transduction histidine kinase/putative methionine-R-sulfoxide reductase with GAF domain